jgi:uncharacterized protein (UPF0333 family)
VKIHGAIQQSTPANDCFCLTGASVHMDSSKLSIFLSNLKGQISLEFLFIFLIFISALSLFLFQFSKTKTSADQHFQEIIMRKYGSDISSTINSLCILGQGNVREINVYFLDPVNITSQDNSLFISSGNFTLEYTVSCKLAQNSIITKGPFLIINYTGDRIQIK